MEMGHRIKTYREAKGWTQTRLAEEMSRVKGKSVSRESVSQWEAGETYPRAPNVVALATVFDKPEWEFQRFGGDTAKLAVEDGRHSIPLLSWPQLKHLGAGGMLKIAARNIQQLQVDERVPKRAFAVTIQDMSMAPQFMPGEEVVIDPKVLPEGNHDDPDFVLARVNKTSQFVFRQYHKRGKEAFDLVGRHKDCQTISAASDDPNITLLGTMVEHRRKRRHGRVA